MEYSQKYCLIQPIVPLQIGDEFAASDWPLHVTIVGVFALNWNENYFLELLKLIKNHHIFSSQTMSIEYFGPKREVKVRLVEQNQKLQVLHTDIANFIAQSGGIFNDPQYQFDSFRPHVTMRGDKPGENLEITFDKFALIDMFPNGDHTRRKIIRLFELSQN